jgi:hypothetical protein
MKINLNFCLSHLIFGLKNFNSYLCILDKTDQQKITISCSVPLKRSFVTSSAYVKDTNKKSRKFTEFWPDANVK